MRPCEKCGSPVEYDSTRENLCCMCADVNCTSRAIALEQLPLTHQDADRLKYIGQLLKTTSKAIVAIDVNMFISLAERIDAFIDHQDNPQVEEPKKADITWTGKLMYKLRGYAQPRFEELGVLGAGEQSVVMQKAKQIAEKWLSEEYPEKDQVENWEVKVRPTA